MEQTERTQELFTWLEGTVKRIMEHPEDVRGIAVYILLTNQDMESRYYNCDMFDQLVISGLIQQDAAVKAIKDAIKGIEEEGDEDDE